jgi:predicted nucleotidyltransferase
MDQPGDQLAALADAARALADGGIPHALIGGIAVGIHSEVPRATDDVDIAIPTSVSVDRVIEVLTEAGFTVRGTFEHRINLRHQSGEPVQVSFDASFDEMIDRAEEIEVGGEATRIITKQDLITTKERAARDPSRRKSKALRDQADVELLRGDVPDPDEGW